MPIFQEYLLFKILSGLQRKIEKSVDKNEMTVGCFLNVEDAFSNTEKKLMQPHVAG